jgi:hypothetical protein
MKKFVMWFVGLFQSKPKETTVENEIDSLGSQFEGETPSPTPVVPKRQESRGTTPTRPSSSTTQRNDDYDRRRREEDQRRTDSDQLMINTIMLNEMIDSSPHPEPEPYRHSNHGGVEQHTVTHSTPSYESHYIPSNHDYSTPSHNYGGSGGSTDSGTTSTCD